MGHNVEEPMLCPACGEVHREHGICASCGEHTHWKQRSELGTGRLIRSWRECQGCCGVHSHRRDDST